MRTLTENSATVIAVAISPDGTRVAGGLSNHLVKIWDAATGAEVSSSVGVRGGW